MNITFVTSDWGVTRSGIPTIPGGANWHRVRLPAMALAAAGHHVVIGHGVGGHKSGALVALDHNGRILLHPQEEGGFADIVICQRWMHADTNIAIRAARDCGQIVLQDIDDWFWGLDPRNAAHKSTAARANREINREHYRKAAEASDGVIVSTEFLGKRIRERFGVQTYLARNFVDEGLFAVQKVRHDPEQLAVGWVGALAWRSGDLETMRGWLPQYLDEVDGLFVHNGIFGHDTPDDTAGSRAGVPAERFVPGASGAPPWDYPRLLMQGFDIGTVPLSVQDFNSAKSWIKGLEYATAGIPFIAQRTREYEALGAGLLASTPAEWLAAARALADPEYREFQAARGLAVAAEHGVKGGRAWVDLLARLLPPRGAETATLAAR